MKKNGITLKYKKKIAFFIAIIFIGIMVLMNIISKFKADSDFQKTRNSYEEIINQLSKDDITDNTYIVSISMETDFKLENSYDKYDSQYDMTDVTVKLSNDFETLDINERCAILKKIDEEIIILLTKDKEDTGYLVMLDSDYVAYKGSNLHIEEYLNIKFASSSNFYTFDYVRNNNYDYISIKEDGKFGYTKYDMEWNDNKIVAIKESESYSNNYHMPAEEDYNSLTYYTVTNDKTLGEVWAMAQSFIKDQLKSPKSADFPTYGDSNVNITNSGDYYKVTGYVDAENGFGAEIRSTFSLVMKKSGSKYTLKECNIY